MQVAKELRLLKKRVQLVTTALHLVVLTVFLLFKLSNFAKHLFIYIAVLVYSCNQLDI